MTGELRPADVVPVDVVLADVVLAHGGGIPEALPILLPLLLFGGFVYAERRARQKERAAGVRRDGTPLEDAPDAPTEDRSGR